ncbi:unnamed protein product [Natator depressus]
MAECVAHPSSAWHSGRQPPHTSALCPLELMDRGVTEQAPSLEQPPPSLDLGGEEDIDSPLDPDVPYPDLAPVVFFCLKQTTSPRNWCIKMSSSAVAMCDQKELLSEGRTSEKASVSRNDTDRDGGREKREDRLFKMYFHTFLLLSQ